MNTILIITDDEMIQNLLKTYFEEEDFRVEVAQNADEGWKKFLKTNPFVVILDQMLPDAKGRDILKRMKQHNSQTSIIIVTAYGQIKDAVRAMELGAMNYVTKPINLKELQLLVNQALRLSAIISERNLHRKKLQVLVKKQWTPLLFNSHIMKEIFSRCQEIAHTNTTILLQGESGVGKGLFAHYIHQISNRSDAPFIDIDCRTIPETLLESELFGYEPGAGTDAKKLKEGLIEIANTGSLFLDEITGLPITLQGKLLKVIEEKSFRKLGGNKEISVDVRVIVATNTNLKKAVEKGKFREDLFFRISTFPIELPPLRKRKEDIVPLAQHFLIEIKNELHKDIAEIDPEALSALVKHEWPGNIRELRNTIEKAVLTARGKRITVDDLGIKFLNSEQAKNYTPLFYKEAKRQFEFDLLERALMQAKGNQSYAARILGISRNALIRRLHKYKIDLLQFKKH
jgi:two-component system response regulator AtoC